MVPSALPSPRSLDRRLAALGALSVLALVARLFRLGERTFYYDEAWFGYWVLKYLDHGAWSYRPILHGPFFARINAVVFPVFGVNDASARLVVACIGGLLPLSAWLYREHLRDGEVVALGLFLAGNPVLLYYSRFMRKDLPLAAFTFVALGLLVRAYDTGRRRYLAGAAISMGVAFATKESVLLWLVTWLGAGLLVVDQRFLFVLASDPDDSPGSRLRDRVSNLREQLAAWAPALVGSVVLFFAVVVYFYAPRAGPGQPIGLWRALGGEFGTVPDVIWAATGGAFERAIDHWVNGSKQDHPYLPFLEDTLKTLAAGAIGVSVLAVVGFVADRYGRAGSRPLVQFSFYCGVLATIGYPLANNFPVPWSTVHAVVPLTIPAAVGARAVVLWGLDRLPSEGTDALLARSPVPPHAVRAGLAAGLLAYLVVTSGAAALQTALDAPHESPKGEPTGHEIVYYAQAPADLRATVEAIADASARGGDEVDVLYVGDRLAMNESAVERPPATGAWHARMPLPWYTEALGADVESVADAENVTAEAPPVVVTTVEQREAVAEKLGDDYDARRQPLDDVDDRVVVVFTRDDESEKS